MQAICYGIYIHICIHICIYLNHGVCFEVHSVKLVFHEIYLGDADLREKLIFCKCNLKLRPKINQMSENNLHNILCSGITMIKMLTFVHYFLTLLNSLKIRGLGCGVPATRVRRGNPSM